jgi:hypothetical protein
MTTLIEHSMDLKFDTMDNDGTIKVIFIISRNMRYALKINDIVIKIICNHRTLLIFTKQ